MNRLASYQRKLVLLTSVWIAVSVAGASQWYLYDAVHNHAERFGYYLATCAYLCGVLAPVVIWSGDRRPIDARTWKRAVPIHILASLLLTGLGVSLEAAINWLPHADEWRFSGAFRHYFTQHTQICLLTYWALLAALHVYRVYDRARVREVQAAQLEAQLAEAQINALRLQLQPHFLFNTLQAATMLVYDDPEGAEEILLSLSELLRISFQSFQRQEVPLRDEIEFLRHYAAIQQRRFGDRLRFDFQIDEQSQSSAVPSLLLQPLVENAIRHGIGKHKEPDEISVRAFSSGNRLCLEVSNLTSAIEGAWERLSSRGVGLANTLARLEQLYGTRQSFEIRNLQPRGVVVCISIPERSMAATGREFVEEAAR